MVIVIRRRQAGMLVLLLAVLMAAGFIWAAANHSRSLRVVQVDDTPAAAPAAATEVAAREVEIKVKPAQGNLFDEYRLERDRARAAQMELLKMSLAAPDLSDERRSQLSAELFALLKKGEQEMQAETLLKAKGFADAVVVLTQHGANAVVTDVLEKEDAARVGDLVAQATGVRLERITIIDGAVGS